MYVDQSILKLLLLYFHVLHFVSKYELTADESPPQQGKDKQVMGVPLVHLLTGRQLIPPVIEKLITAIELHGLYTEGLYRKTGAASKIRQLVKTLNAGQHNVHIMSLSLLLSLSLHTHQTHMYIYSLPSIICPLYSATLT